MNNTTSITHLQPLHHVVCDAEAVVVEQEQRLPEHVHGLPGGRLFTWWSVSVVGQRAEPSQTHAASQPPTAKRTGPSSFRYPGASTPGEE